MTTILTILTIGLMLLVCFLIFSVKQLDKKIVNLEKKTRDNALHLLGFAKDFLEIAKKDIGIQKSFETRLDLQSEQIKDLSRAINTNNETTK